MANGYLNFDEVCGTLGKSSDEVKALIRAGKLREVRDAGKILFKKSDVERIAAVEGSSVVDLKGASPEVINLDDNESFASALSSLADSSASLGALDESPESDGLPKVDPGERSGSASGISFADDSGIMAVNPDDIPEELPAAKSRAGSKGGTKASAKTEFSSEIDLLPTDEKGGSSMMGKPAPKPAAKPAAPAKGFEDVPDLGLSGSSIISLEPGDSKIIDSPVAKEGTKVTKAGITVFEEDELGVASDPMGETQISAGAGEFDSVGSGSGLLDLTQESDDTSLGAELLDVISPTEAGETEVEAHVIDDDAPVSKGGSAVMVPQREAAVMQSPSIAARTMVGAVDAGTLPLNICLFIGILGMAILGLATASVLQGAWPDALLGTIGRSVIHWSVFGGLAAAVIGTGIWGLMAGRK